jgi:hypothetical protein
MVDAIVDRLNKRLFSRVEGSPFDLPQRQCMAVSIFIASTNSLEPL